MPTVRSMPMHPQALAQVRPPAARTPGVTVPPGMYMDNTGGFRPLPTDPNLAVPFGDPQQLNGLNPGAPPPMQGAPNPFMGNRMPGAYATPAPFSPGLAPLLMAQRGQMGPVASSAMFPRGPLGGFGTPERQRPRSTRNPYQGGGPR